jgi:ATP-dependent DNA helicase RecG
VKELVKSLVLVISKTQSRPKLMTALDLRHNANFRDNYLRPAMEAGFVKMTDPNSPNSPKQRYRLTTKRRAMKKKLENRS